jgi:hypothetical protein
MLLISRPAGVLANHKITSEGFALLPTLSPDSKTVYYLLKSGLSSRGYVNSELWRTDLASGRAEPALPGVGMTYYSLSHKGRKLLYASDSTAPPGLWIADLDRGTPPRQLTTGGEDRAYFGAPGQIIYQSNAWPGKLMRVATQLRVIPRRLVRQQPLVNVPSISKIEYGRARWRD